VALLVVAAIGGFVLARRGDDSATVAASSVTPPSSTGRTTTTTALPDTGPSAEIGTHKPTSVVASSTRPTGKDACDPPKPTSFSAANLIDGRSDTAWMPTESDPSPNVTVTFAEPVRISELQLVNGYPKTDPCRSTLYRYFQYARPTVIEADFHDDSTPRQLPVLDIPDAQTLRVSGTTDQLTLRVLKSEPPDPSRIVTGAQTQFLVPAISELSFRGSTGD
jgi:hypothetical protein